MQPLLAAEVLKIPAGTPHQRDVHVIAGRAHAGKAPPRRCQSFSPVSLRIRSQVESLTLDIQPVRSISLATTRQAVRLTTWRTTPFPSLAVTSLPRSDLPAFELELAPPA